MSEHFFSFTFALSHTSSFLVSTRSAFTSFSQTFFPAVFYEFYWQKMIHIFIIDFVVIFLIRRLCVNVFTLFPPFFANVSPKLRSDMFALIRKAFVLGQILSSNFYCFITRLIFNGKMSLYNKKTSFF